MKRELVSVLMPVYNSGEYLREAIESILSQTYSNFEFLIINDASTDNSEKIVKAFKDPRIRYYVNHRNLGIVSTLNAAIKQCKGTLVARMDADDVAHSERIERQVSFFSKYPDISLISTWYLTHSTINDHTKVVRRRTDDREIRFHMLFRNQFLHPGVMIKKQLLSKLKYRNVSTCEDYDLWARSLKHAKVANYPEVLMVYRWHGNNISITNQAQLRKSMILIISELLTEYHILYTQDELLLQTMIALGFDRDHLITLNKLSAMNIWLEKLENSEALHQRFGQKFVQDELAEYFEFYEFK